ncbi:MAG: hypothetical protein ACFFDN_12700 [Candidatus Hodarchaeota archaeon]
MSNKYLIWAAVIISIIIIIVHNMLIFPWMLDDSYISFRYAENFASGQGLVYNIDDKVEGYTNFLWVVFLGLGKKIGIDIIIFSKILGTLFCIGCIFLLINSHRIIKNISASISITATLFLGTCGIFTPWATSGMEVSMFAFFILFSVLLYVSTKQSTNTNWRLGFVGFISAISTMIRPEGMLIFVIIFIDQLVESIKSKNRLIIYLAIFFLVTYLPYFAWRYFYYGYLLPNTFYAKVGFSIDQMIRGIQYFVRWLNPGFLLVISALLALFSQKWFRKYSNLSLLPLLVIFYILYIICVGGDCMPAFRFFAPIMPLLCLISAMSIILLTKTKRATIFIVLVIVLFNIAQMRIDTEIYTHIINDKVAHYGKEVGLWLKANVPQNAIIATNTAGSIPFYSGLKTIDMLGMNDKHIAHREISSLGKGWAGHEKGDGAYVLSIKPDYIQFGSSLGSKYPVFLSDGEIYNDSTFHDRYALKIYRLDSGKDLLIYEKKENNNK